MKVILATHNTHKMEELRRILIPLGIEAVIDSDIGITLTEADETGSTFAENAFLKAELACRESGLPAIADDSGLCIDALNGEPGVYSARYAPVGQRKQTVLKALQQVEEERRTAHFASAVCCVFPNGDTVTAEGICEGKIGYEPRGEGGFGYDPIFVTACGKTFAELTARQKDEISHRGRALRAFAENLKAYLDARAEKEIKEDDK